MYLLATLVYFQLKYCERCAGLWLRPDGTSSPYCPNCEHILAALPTRTPRPNRKIDPATPAPAAEAPLSTAADFPQPVPLGVL